MPDIDRPLPPEFLDLTYSPEAATGLTATNDLVRQLRMIPDKLLTPPLRDDRNRVLDKALPDLLVAHRDARVAGADVADAELVAGLEHIRVEVLRIITACRANAGNTLAIQGKYLADVYPVESENPLALLEGSSSVDALVSPPTEGDRRQVDRQSIEALFCPASETAGNEISTVPATRHAKAAQVAYAILYAALVLLAPILAIWGLFYGIQWLNHRDQPPEPTFRPDRVELTATIDRVRRSGIEDTYNPTAPRKSGAIVNLHGVVHNRTRDHVLQRQYVRVDLYSCPNGHSPLLGCNRITYEDPEVTDDMIRPGVAARWSKEEALPMPDVTGTLRAVVRPDASIFDDTPRP